MLQQHALEVAETYIKDQDLWMAAAQTLRAPYWDWVVDILPPPEVISLENLSIIGSDGKPTDVLNPLLHYRFHQTEQSFPERWRLPTTIRYPSHEKPNMTDVQALKRYEYLLHCDFTFLYLLFLPKPFVKQSGRRQDNDI